MEVTATTRLLSGFTRFGGVRLRATRACTLAVHRPRPSKGGAPDIGLRLARRAGLTATRPPPAPAPAAIFDETLYQRTARVGNNSRMQ